MDISYSRSCANTAAFALLVEGWNELVQDGFTPEGLAVCPVSADCECLYAYSDADDIVGALAFKYDKAQDANVIVLAYVEPSSRKRGVFTALLTELKNRSGGSESSAGRILITVPADNKIGTEVAAKLGSPTTSSFRLWQFG
ncbi:GNAT family N-acetyltransferase [Hyphomicrobium sp. ghe19]|uniref:GNAT family N-acetyltransferase n=1 Tax=Hyphomicrobium sp. ghe19 TaxID=2682968 RepID=UPI0013673E22|nr:hypothetical protein HYPP_02539 [Hyphomicrobium sp. ghe19]